MAKESGMGDNFYIGGYNLSTDVSALDTIACRRAALDVTSIDKSAPERISAAKPCTSAFRTHDWRTSSVRSTGPDSRQGRS